MAAPCALILKAPGTNCDEETAAAWSLAGAEVETRHVARVVAEPSEPRPIPDPHDPRRLLLRRRPGAGGSSPRGLARR